MMASRCRRFVAPVARIACRCSISALTVVGVILTTACDNGGDGEKPVDKFSRSARATPLWNGGPAPSIPPKPKPEPEAIDVHLDISAPMAGFLPPASNAHEPSVLRTAAQNVASHLTRLYGGGGVSIRWRAVGHDLRDLPGMPRFERTLFDGRWSRLTLSIESILSDFQTGHIEAAALVTDLMATGDITGPLAVSNALSDWLASDDVRSGTFHVGLLATRANYRGWQPAGCPERTSELGCVFNERTGAITPLAEVKKIPLYVLVLGKDFKKVEGVIESVRQGIEELGKDLEIKHEILTRKSRGFDTTMSCIARKPGDHGENGSQYVLFEDNMGNMKCRRDESVALSCSLSNGFQLTSASTAFDGNGAMAGLSGAADVRDVEGRLDLDIDCAQIAGPLKLRLNDVVGEITHHWEVAWDEWSTEIDELGKTLQLEGFVQELRITPDSYRIELQQPLLQFSAP